MCASLFHRGLIANSTLVKRAVLFGLFPFGLFLFLINSPAYQFEIKFGPKNYTNTNKEDRTFYAQNTIIEDYPENGQNKTPVFYAIYDTHTPNIDGLRAFDYAFYLPLTALAWERIGFVSFIVIVGSRCEWENDPVLQVILNHLKERRAILSFMPAPLENRLMLSQTARIFGANMEDFPGRPDDYLITSDSDLWPLAKSFYVRPPGKDIVLVHGGGCCGDFLYKGDKYRMYPLGNIGMTVSTWREVMNEDQRTVAKDSDSILQYYEDEYGSFIRRPVKYASPEWFYDQKLVSIRIAQWIQRHGNDTVEWGTNQGFDRVDRANWKPENLTQIQFEKMYDAHLPGKIYRPENWNRTLPLLKLMYGQDSSEKAWATKYADEFFSKVKNFPSLVN